MRARIADLIVEIPEVGDLIPRCREYLCSEKEGTDIVLRTDLFHPNLQNLNENVYFYLASGACFYRQLLKYDGMMIHASAIELDGKAYLFSGNCGSGKSTHTLIWRQIFGENARIINDDKPAIRIIGGKWYAYGTPWCGKDGININTKLPLAGICFLKQAEENKMRRLNQREAVQKIIQQTVRRLDESTKLNMMLSHVDNLVRMIPVYELENRPEPEAAYLSYETMRRTAEDMGL